jgi:subtilisin family serine protease
MRNSILACAAVGLLLSSYVHHLDASKQRITSIDDVPRHTYTVPRDVTELIRSPEAFESFAAAVRIEIEQDLDAYVFDDRSTLQQLYNVLMMLDVHDGQYEAALEKIARMRDLEDKITGRLTMGLISTAILHARLAAGSDSTKYTEAFVGDLVGSLNELPWETVQQRIEELRGRYAMRSENFLLGVLETEYGDAVRQTGQIGNEAAYRVIAYQYIIAQQLPLQENILAVFDEYIARHRTEKVDIWQDRNVDLAGTKDLTPVVIGIWDSGVDTTLFRGRLFINRGETPNNRDDDDNGYVDDVHGIAYTFEEEPTPDMLYPLGASAEELARMKVLAKGLFDLMAGIGSQEAQSLQQYMMNLKPQEVGSFMEALGGFAHYNHGTHTAGVAVAGNPAARILIARLTVDHSVPPPVPTIERAQKAARSYAETVEYFKVHGVRVVNMSWGGTLSRTEEDLELNGVGADAEERAQRAREIFDIERNGLYQAIKKAPDILFVCAAGNENDDVVFEEYYPASFDLPNVMAVGAVDQSGDETSFTSYGDIVRVYGNGYEVSSFLVGGDTMAVSGTSVAAPQVTNLAAKLLAVDPALSVEEIVRLIIGGADGSSDDRFLRINPKRSLALLETK